MDGQPGGPPASGQRLPWEGLPAAVRAAVSRHLPAPVVHAATQPGGFSPGVAARLRLADGSRAFVKAVGPEPNPHSADIHRAEIRIASALPANAPTPRLRAGVEVDGWVALLFDDVDGRLPRTPWDPVELARVLDALTDLARALTPAPVDAPPARTAMADVFGRWQRVTADEPGLHPWAARNLDRLLALEAAPGVVDGDTLLHRDLRADNMLLTGDGVVFVDWPWACRGAAWLDLACMLPSVAMHGGVDPEAIFTGHPVGAAAPPADVTAMLVGVAGYFVVNGLRPAPPGLPTLRPFQRAQGVATLDWLRRRTGWA